VDAERETIELVATKRLGGVSTLSSEISSTDPRFTFFRFTHKFKGESLDSIGTYT